MMGIIYWLLALIDSIVYGLASSLFGLIADLANTQFFTSDQIKSVADRIYIVVGVLMLFKLVISAIQYMINPDMFEDKEKGLAGILKKTVISIGLIVLVPVIFDFLIEIQEPIIKTLPDIVLGPGTTEKTDEKSIGFNLSFKVLSAFIKINDSNSKALTKGDNAGVGDGKEIHDFGSFVEHVGDDCPPISLFGLAGNTNDCQYSYMVIISTLCGGFLCYVLLSMVLDVSIRTIKFGVIRILAPIPIAGYIFSKDRLNKFVKTATTVYFDLFIRMIIIYFVIFAIKSMIIENGLLDILAHKDGASNDWFRNVIVNIALIIGLLMFAKSAPKFISELLGLPDIGSGAMADMFKPGRLTGLAGAALNPARNAISNYKKAMENNTDMSSKGKRIRNALRHASAGAARGSFDAALGVANGDDWAKMTQRHNKSVAASNRRGAANYMKRTDKQEARERNAEVNKRREELEKLFKSEGININDRKRYFSSIANDAYKNRLSGLNTQISDLQHRLATDTSLSSEEFAQKNAELKSMVAERDRMMTSDGRKAWIENKTNEYVAQDIYSKEISSKRDRQAQIATELARARAEYVTSTGAEQERLGKKITDLVNEQQEIDNVLANPDQLMSSISEYVSTGTLKTEKPNISTKSIISGKVDKFFGGEGFTGQGFIDTADLLKNNRSNLYTGEAMTKMRQNADILVEADGTPASFTSTFATDNSRKYSYAYIADLKRKADSGATINWAKEGFENAAMLQSAFEEIEKKAAEAYVTANMAAADPTVHSEFKLKRGEANTTIVEGIKRMKAQLAGSNIPKEERDQLIKELSENPGKFFKTASDRQERMRTRGSRISAYNSGKKDGQS